MHYLYTTFVYDPLYNGLVVLMNAAHLVSWVDAGIVVVIFTVIVKLILFPISKKAARTQLIMNTVAPELEAIKKKFKDDKQAQARETLAFYKQKEINPFSSIFLLFIQLPIIFALYKIFYTTGFSSVNTEILYSWVSIPPAIGTHFLGLIDVSQKSAILAILAAVSQYFQINISMPKSAPRQEGAKLHDDLVRNMQTQMKYVFPVMILFISWNVAGALALYWVTSNLFMIAQELYIRKQLLREKATK